MAYSPFTPTDPWYWFNARNEPLNQPYTTASFPWSRFGMSEADLYGRPLTWGAPSRVRNPIARLVYSLPRWLIAGRQAAIDRSRYNALATQDRVIDLPVVRPTGLNKKQLAKWEKKNAFRLPQAITVPGVGLNNPLVEGSRADPRGVIRPVF
jgi:hypothetical protein